ncbi:MAG: hypothetical protein GXZ06_03910 [Tissierellia bacterium]|nr:hypothetical protein [Tissierellia bacterium]
MEGGSFIKRFILEFGMGVDFHGQDVNRAAERAVLDAISRSCLCGLQEILGIENFNEQVAVNVILSVSRPEAIDEERIKKCLPIGKKKVTAVKGGLQVPGLYIPEFGDKDKSIEAVLACVEVEII